MCNNCINNGKIRYFLESNEMPIWLTHFKGWTTNPNDSQIISIENEDDAQIVCDTLNKYLGKKVKVTEHIFYKKQ